MNPTLDGKPTPPVFALPGITGQTALIAAGTSGIGLETARILAASGARAVIVNGRNPQRGEAVRAELAARYPQTEVVYLPADLQNETQVATMFDQVSQRFGRLDALVHCGGAQIRPDLFVNTPVSDFKPMIDGHFTAILYTCHHAVPLLKAAGGGAIVVIASDAGKTATPAESLIGAAKAAAIMFVRCLAMELSRDNIRANVLTPSIVRETLSYDRVMAGELSRKVFEKAERRARLGVPTPRDIAPMVAFLVSTLSSKTTGQAISVNGGISAA